MTNSSQDRRPEDSAILALLGSLVDRFTGEKPLLNKEMLVDAEKDSTFLDQSLLAAREFFERQAAGGLSLITPQETAEDAIAICGRRLELKLDLGRVQALAGNRVHFLIDNMNVGDASVTNSRRACLDYTPEKAGCFSMDFQVSSKRGVNAVDSRSRQDVVLHVLDKRPVVCVDARLLSRDDSKFDSKLKKLAKHNIDIVYIDFGKKDRIEEIRKLRKEKNLPLGGIIPLSVRIRQFESFDVDFQQTFLSLAVNRLRARGAPVVALITECEINRQEVFPEVGVYAPGKRFDMNLYESLNKAARKFVKRRSQFRSLGNAEILWRIEQLVPGQWVKDNHCYIELNNKFARQTLFKAIDQAEKRIDLQFYIFKESRFSHELGMHLSKAASRGVEVRLMVDALWSGENFFGNWNSFLSRVKKMPNINVLATDSARFSDEWEAIKLRQRDHRKIIIIDNLVAFVGGRNAGDEYYYDWSEVAIADWTEADYIPWLDAHVELRGPGVNAVQQLFNQTWLRNGGKPFVKLAKTIKSETDNADSSIRLIVHEGTRDANGLASYEALIGGAQKQLYLVNDFPVLDDIADLLIRAVKRGVKVTFLTGNVLARKADGSFFEGARHREVMEYVTKSRLGTLVDAGVFVVEFQTAELDNIATEEGKVRPYVHAKMITADGRYASIGSSNLDITASYWEREANIFIDDTQVVKKLNRRLQALVKSGVPLDTSSREWRREAPQREIVSRLWPETFLS